MNDFDQVYQGDVMIMRLPDKMKISKEAEIAPLHGKLILQEGEMTGHHHYVDSGVLDKPEASNKSTFSNKKLEEMFTKKASEPVAKLYHATKVAEELVQKRVLTRTDLVVGLLEIENGPMKVMHQEHDSITLPPGRYVYGRQVESVAGEERRVAD